MFPHYIVLLKLKWDEPQVEEDVNEFPHYIVLLKQLGTTKEMEIVKKVSTLHSTSQTRIRKT